MQIDDNPNASARRYMPWVAALGFYIAGVAATLFFSTLSPNIAGTLGLDHGQLGLLGGIYYVAFSVSQLVLGSLLGPVSPRLILAPSAMIAALGFLLFTTSVSLEVAIAAQVLIGIGLSTTFVGCVHIIGRDLPRHFSLLTATSQALANLAGTAVAILGATTTLLTSFRPVFLVAFAVMTGLAVALYFLADPGKGTKVPSTAGKVPAASALASCVRSGQFWVALVYYSCLFGSIIAYSGLWNMQFQVSVFHHTVFDSSLTNAMLPMGMVIGSLVAGVWAHRIGDFVFPARAFALFSLAVVAVMMLFVLSEDGILAANLALGAGLCGSILALGAVKAHLPVSAQPMGTALLVTGACLVGGLVQPVIGIIMDMPVHSSPLYDFTRHVTALFGLDTAPYDGFASYQYGFGLIGGFVLVGFASSLFLRPGPGNQ